jgi:MFS family permease
VAYTASFWLLLNLHEMVRRLGKSAMFFLSLVLKIAAIAFLMVLPENNIWSSFFLIVYLVLGTIEWVSMDVILESFSVDNMSGRIRGKHLTFINAGFLVAPFLSFYILGKQGFDGVFILLFFINSFILLVSLLGIRKVNHDFKGRIGIREVLGKMWKRKNLLRIYYISFVFELFYAVMIMYTSIHLETFGFGEKEVGDILTIMLIPFVLVQYPMGVLADKRWGEKEMIIVSLIIMTIATASVFFISSLSILVWGAVLFATRVGAALLEVLRDSYFYKRVDSSEVDLINFFRTTMPVAYIVTAFLTYIILLFFPMRSVFIFGALVIASALIPAIFLVDNKCEKELRAGQE